MWKENKGCLLNERELVFEFGERVREVDDHDQRRAEFEGE